VAISLSPTEELATKAGSYARPTIMPEFLSREKEIVEGNKLKMRMI
jgi:hypothetical protein